MKNDLEQQMQIQVGDLPSFTQLMLAIDAYGITEFTKQVMPYTSPGDFQRGVEAISCLDYLAWVRRFPSECPGNLYQCVPVLHHSGEMGLVDRIIMGPNGVLISRSELVRMKQLESINVMKELIKQGRLVFPMDHEET